MIKEMKELISEMNNDDAHEVVRWIASKKELQGNQFRKACLLNLYDCIKYDSVKKRYLILPLNMADGVNYEGIEYEKIPYEKNYNSTVYVLEAGPDNEKLISDYDGRYVCNCQWFQKMRMVCTHIKALHIHWKFKSLRNKCALPLEAI